MPSDKIAPVQGYSAGIPWSMHLRAYDVYCKKYGPQESLITGRCRGGFHVEELDQFIPGWRDELDELTATRAALRNLVEEAKAREFEKKYYALDGPERFCGNCHGNEHIGHRKECPYAAAIAEAERLLRESEGE